MSSAMTLGRVPPPQVFISRPVLVPTNNTSSWSHWRLDGFTTHVLSAVMPVTLEQTKTLSIAIAIALPTTTKTTCQA